MKDALLWFFAALVFAGAIPPLVGCYQFFLAGLHRFRGGDDVANRWWPRVALIIPAWNEGLVIGRTIDQLSELEYPPGRLRIYIVDDGSDDDTPEILAAKQRSTRGWSSPCDARTVARARRTRSTTACRRSSRRAGTTRS